MGAFAAVAGAWAGLRVSSRTVSLVVAILYITGGLMASRTLVRICLSGNAVHSMAFVPFVAANSLVPLLGSVVALIGLWRTRGGREAGRLLRWPFAAIAVVTGGFYLFAIAWYAGPVLRHVFQWRTLAFGMATGVAVALLWWIHRRRTPRPKWLGLCATALSLLAVGLGGAFLEEFGFGRIVIALGPALALAVLWWRRARREATAASETDGTQGTNG